MCVEEKKKGGGGGVELYKGLEIYIIFHFWFTCFETFFFRLKKFCIIFNYNNAQNCGISFC